MSAPDFLGIGVSRAGTTYLYQYLRAHPQVWLPPVKELHFFDSHKYGWPTRDGRRFRHRLRFLLATMRQGGQTWKSNADRRFALNYLRGDLDSTISYRRHFPRRERGVVTGEITPDYCELDAARIATIKREFPEVKLLLTIRHPLERFESQARKYMEQTGDTDAIAAVSQWIEQPGFVKSFDYADIIGRWREIFGEKNLHVTYFDQLERDPERFLNETCRFLGVTPWVPDEAVLKRRINSSRQGSIDEFPEELLGSFARTILPLCAALAEKEPATPSHWCRDLERAATKK